MPLLLNQLQASSIRLYTPWKGPWFADVELPLDDLGIPPVGPCILTIGTTPMVGFVDPAGSGKFGLTAKARVVAGRGGWGKTVLSLPISNPAGVLSTQVYTQTGAEVLETVVDVIPKILGDKTYLRSAGPASAVFGDADWYVSAQGVTFVGPRAPLPLDLTSAEIISYDPLTRVAEVSSDSPITPGTILIDTLLRITSPLIVRDVEQTWTGEGKARATCWCADEAGSRLQTGLRTLVRHLAGTQYLKTYVYRVVLQDPSTEDLILQIVDPDTNAPDALPIELWMGVPGVGAKLLLGTEVLVTFANGEPGRPCVVGFKHGDQPLLLEIDGLLIQMGGEAATGVATELSMTPLLTALIAHCASSQAFYNFPLIAALSGGTAQAAAASAAALATVAALPTNFSLRVRAA